MNIPGPDCMMLACETAVSRIYGHPAPGFRTTIGVPHGPYYLIDMLRYLITMGILAERCEITDVMISGTPAIVGVSSSVNDMGHVVYVEGGTVILDPAHPEQKTLSPSLYKILECWRLTVVHEPTKEERENAYTRYLREKEQQIRQH